MTGTTVILPPPDTVAGVDVRGGGTGTREIESIGPHANPKHVHGLVLTGGSAFGLGCVDGVMRWLEERGVGHETPAGKVPIVPAAVIYDLVSGSYDRRPGREDAYTACERAISGVPQRGSVGAGTGAAVGKLLGRERAVKGGVGYGAHTLDGGATVAVVAVANAFGDVIAADGTIMAGARSDSGDYVGATRLLRERGLPFNNHGDRQNTVLVAVLTSAAMDRSQCTAVARMASAGIARAVDPVHTAFDGDVVFCLAAPEAKAEHPSLVGAVAASIVSDAIRDAVARAERLGAEPTAGEVEAHRP